MCQVRADPVPVPAASHWHRDVPGALAVPFLQPSLALTPHPKCTTAVVLLESKCVPGCGRHGKRHAACYLLPVACCLLPPSCAGPGPPRSHRVTRGGGAGSTCYLFHGNF